jgi:tRNA-dependent cyclodipeptide synthase
MVKRETDVVIASLAKLPKEKDVSEKSAILLVSIGAENEGANFIATLDMIKSIGFKKVKILVADTLQRFTLYGLNAVANIEEAAARAREAGDHWLAKHTHLIKQNGFEIIRWQDLLIEAEYSSFKKEIDALYQDNSKIQLAVDDAANSFYERYENLQAYLKFDKLSFIEQSKQYLLEECPFIPLWYKQGIDYLLYPNSPNNAIQAMINYFVKDNNMLNWLRFDFSYRKASEIKLNAIQNNRHGFSINREELKKITKSDMASSYFLAEFFKLNEVDKIYNSAIDKNGIMPWLDDIIESINQKIISLPNPDKMLIHRKIREKLLID